MTSYLSNLLTTTTSRYNDLRRTLLRDEADGDTEDDTHITRVLRAYYIEKARPFPDWLPPDPRAKALQSPGQAYVSTNRPGLQSASSGSSSRRGGGVSDLWDTPGPQTAQQPSSLRRSARTGGGPQPSAMAQYGPGSGYRHESTSSNNSGDNNPSRGSMGSTSSLGSNLSHRPDQPQHAYSATGPYRNSRGSSPGPGNGEPLHPATSAPVPGPRAGGYQSTASISRSDASSPALGATVSAQERLKARLWGQGRSGSPGPTRGGF